MSRALRLLLLAMLAAASPAAAQSAGRAPIRGGDIQGLELGMEGALRAPRGGTLRWLLSTYEVVGASDLRPCPGCEIQLTTSLDPSAAPRTLQADASGRAALELAVPADAPTSFAAVLRLSIRGVQRRFELTVQVEDPRSLTVRVARRTAPRGAPIHVVGRLSSQATGLPIAGAAVELTARDAESRPVATPVTVRTDACGMYAHVFRLPRELRGVVMVGATSREEDRTVVAATATQLEDPSAPELLVAIAPAQQVVPPDGSLDLEVAVRTSEGRPVRGATLELSGLAYDDPARTARTDARGRARMRWRVPSIGTPWADLAIAVSASREGVGSGAASVAIRVAQVDHAAAIAVEGGAIVPELGGRVFVRVVGIDGRPAGAGVPVRLSGPRLGADRAAQTDASGAAVFDVQLAPASADPSGRCGGDAQAAARVVVGDGARAHSLDACLPLDPDGTVRVRPTSPRVRTGGALELDLARAASVARVPIVVSAITMSGAGPAALGMRVVAAGETHASIPIPADAVGPILIRARPIAASGREVRGGSALAWSEAGEPIAVHASLDARGVHVERSGAPLSAGGSAPGPLEATAWAIALPLDEARQLAEGVRGEALGPIASLRVDPSAASEALISGALSAATPLDTAAPWILRAGQPVPVPAPSDPVAAALLRDPWRAQARFVTGRLALVFSAIERHVAASVPERIDDVSVQTRGRWDFNAQILQAVAESGDLGGEGATGLGGEPLTVEALRRIDPAFTYDRVASRITRERLYRLLVLLRGFVQQNAFDLPWARVGDPATWLRHLPDLWVEGVGQIQRRELVDAWGRPFVLRAITGRARFASWSPLPGWELFSSGPDGRPGNGDDVADPTARVLPSGSPYAQAVGEDVLLARLTGVELGRATIDLVRGVVSAPVSGVPSEPEAAAQQEGMRLWAELPGELERDPDPLALRRPAEPGNGAGGRLVPLASASATLDLASELDEEPREWGAVVLAWSRTGSPAIAEARARLGSPLIVETELPARLREGEPVTLELQVTNASEVDRRVAIALRGEGPLEGSAPELSLGAGTSERVELTLRGTDVGRARPELAFLEGGAAIRTLRWSAAIDRGLHPIRVRAATALVRPEWHTSLDVPGDSARPAARIVVMHPASLHRDPDLAPARHDDPALLAWAAALAGHPIDPDLRARLLLAQQGDGSIEGADPSVSTACALVALSTFPETDTDATHAAWRARDVLGGTGIGFDEMDSEAISFRSWSQQLAALASSGLPDLADDQESAVDPVARHAARLRTWIHRGLRRWPEEPSLLARGAAALLLADPRDAYGLAMLDRASAHLEDVRSGGGRRVVGSETREGGIESLSATLALAIAAHQAGRDELAAALAIGALDRDHVIVRRGGEPLFWMLAAAAYGVFGGGDLASLTIVADGRTLAYELADGVAIVPLEGVRAGARIDVRVGRGASGAAPILRAEAVIERPFREASGGAVELSLAGDPGDVRSVAALELTVRPTRAMRHGIVIDLQLPAGVVADERLIATLGSAIGGEGGIEAREPGFLRIRTGPRDAGVAFVLPLPLRWTVRGDIGGLGVIAHPAEDPGETTILAPRTLAIAAAPDRDGR